MTGNSEEDYHSLVSQHDYHDDDHDNNNNKSNPKGYRTFEFTVSKTTMMDRLKGCGCGLYLDDVCYSLVEYPHHCCLGCKKEISLGAYINAKGSLIKYNNPSMIPQEYLAADGNQKGKTGTVELRISLDSLNGDVESMRREILATCIAHFLEAKTTQYHPDAPKITKEVTNLNDDEY